MMQDEKGRTAGNNVPMIYKALAGVIADVGSVAKDKVNRQQGFKFRSIDDVYNALHPALAKNAKKVIDKAGISKYNVNKVSEYAERMYRLGRYDEVEAEYMTTYRRKRHGN